MVRHFTILSVCQYKNLLIVVYLHTFPVFYIFRKYISLLV
jgi:hypothetical protein